MNGKLKFHKANGPAFNIGEKWIAGKTECQIVSVRNFGPCKWDYEVTYQTNDGREYQKDAWNFQVRYNHIADEFVKG